MKKIFIAIAGLISLSFAATLVLAIFLINLDPNDYKGWISKRFFEQTGHELTIEGDIGLELYPWLNIEVTGLTIANPPGFNGGDFLNSGYAHLRIRLLPLLRGEYDIETMELRDTYVNLTLNEAGENNWTLSPDEAKSGPPDDNGPGNASPLFKLTVGSVDVLNFNLSYLDRGTGLNYNVTDLTLNSDGIVLGNPVDMQLAFNASSSDPDLYGNINLNGTVSYDLEKQLYRFDPLAISGTVNGDSIPNRSSDISLNAVVGIDMKTGGLKFDQLRAEIPGLSVEGDINAQDLLASPQYSTNLTLKGEDLGLLFEIAGENDLADRVRAASAAGSYDVSLNASLNPGNGDFSLSTLQADLLGASINTSVNGTGLNSGRPRLNGSLAARGPDLPTLLEVFGQIQGGADSPLSRFGRDSQSLADKAFSVSTDFDGDFDRGSIRMPSLSASLLGFDIDGEINANDMQSDRGTISGSLTVNNGQLAPLLRILGRDDLADSMQTLNLRLGLNGNRSNISLSPFDLTLGLRNDRGMLSFNAEPRIDLDADTVAIDDFSLSGLGLDTRGQLRLSDFSDAPSVEGNIMVSAFNPRKFSTLFGVTLPETRDAAVLQNLAFSTTFTASRYGAMLDDLNLTLDDSQLKGNFGVSDFNTPAMNFDLTVDAIDLDRYRSPNTAPTSTSTGSSDKSLPVDTLRGLSIDGRLGIDKLVVSNLRMDDVVLGINADQGRIALSPLQASLYQGTYEGSLNLDASGDEAIFSLKSAMNGVMLEPLSTDFLGATYLSGTGDIDLSVSGRGLTNSQIKSSLSGDGNVKLNDGVLHGVDVGGVLTQIETMIRSQRPGQIRRGDETAFDDLSAAINIKNGVVTSQNLLIKAPGFKINGQGTLLNLATNRIDFDLLTSVDPSTATVDSQVYDIGGYTLPIACEGSLSTPRCLPDTDKILSAAVTNALGNLLQRALGGQDQSSQQAPDNTTQDEPSPPAGQDQNSNEDIINQALDRLFR